MPVGIGVPCQALPLSCRDTLQQAAPELGARRRTQSQSQDPLPGRRAQRARTARPSRAMLPALLGSVQQRGQASRVQPPSLVPLPLPAPASSLSLWPQPFAFISQSSPALMQFRSLSCKLPPACAPGPALQFSFSRSSPESAAFMAAFMQGGGGVIALSYCLLCPAGTQGLSPTPQQLQPPRPAGLGKAAGLDPGVVPPTLAPTPQISWACGGTAPCSTLLLASLHLPWIPAQGSSGESFGEAEALGRQQVPRWRPGHCQGLGFSTPAASFLPLPLCTTHPVQGPWLPPAPGRALRLRGEVSWQRPCISLWLRIQGGGR